MADDGKKPFAVVLSAAQRAAYQKAADSHGVSLAQWMRDSCDLRVRAGNPSLAAKPSGPARSLSDPSTFKGPDFKPSKPAKAPDWRKK